MKIIRYTIFNSSTTGNGAEKRTAQIAEILDEAGLDYIFIKKDESIRIPLVSVLLKASIIIPKFAQIIPLVYFKNIKTILKAVRDYIRFEKELSKLLNEKEQFIFLWECTRSDNFFVPVLLKKYKVEIIGLPHNIESLVPVQQSSISLKVSPYWFKEELKYLTVCDKIFCISKEDTLFLKLFGINSYYLPYYPTQDIESYFLNIREKRIGAQRKGVIQKILMLGSANNPPTRMGMLDRIKFFSARDLPVKLTIAGFYTQSLKEEIDIPPSIRITGTISSQELENELMETDAILIHQSASTGALTRISEVLLAGIPIVANFESARNYYNCPGVYVYNDDDQLEEYLKKEIFNGEISIGKPGAEKKVFIKHLSR